MSKPHDVAFRYVGKDGEQLAGIPAADLTNADLDALTPVALRDLNHSSLYEAVADKPAPKAADSGDKEG
jgi:hypothetical protein